MVNETNAHQHAEVPPAAVQHPATHQAAISIDPPMLTPREWKFSFKKQKVREPDGTEIKRPAVTVTVPVPTFEGLIDELASDKVKQFILELVEEAIKDQVRTQLGDDEKPVMRQEDLDIDKLKLSYIAALPKSERTGGGIPKDVWEEWEKDYIAVMGPVRERQSPDGKGVEKATKAAKLLVSRFNPVRTDKPILKFLRDQLAVWATESQQVEEFAEVYQYLDARATELMNRDSAATLAAL